MWKAPTKYSQVWGVLGFVSFGGLGLGAPHLERSVMQTDRDLVEKVKGNHLALLELFSCPAPTADGALLGYEGEIRSLEVEGDELLEECDRRGLDRRYALHGHIKKERWLEAIRLPLPRTN